MALGKGRRRSERAKIDATPPWETRKIVETPPTTGPFDIRDADLDSDTAVGRDADAVDDIDSAAEEGGDAAAAGTARRIDFGALQVPADTGLELRVEVTEAGAPSSVTLSNGRGQMQLGVFAAPRTEGIWDEVRGEIRGSLAQQGGLAEDRKGTFGTELVGRLPQNGSLVPVRFLGVDGPRWFVRAMLVGPAAADAAAGKVFERAFRRLVIVRGETPLPVREPVPLVLPKEIAEQVAVAQNARTTDEPAQGNRPPNGAARRPRR